MNHTTVNKDSKYLPNFCIGSIKEFFSNILSKEISTDYAVYMEYGGNEFYHNETAEEMSGQHTGATSEAEIAGDKSFKAQWAVEKSVQIYDKNWTIKVLPTRQFIQGQRTMVPAIVLVAGLLIALLLAATVRYILISRIKSNYLAKSEERYDLAVRGMSVGVWDWNVASGQLFWSEKFNHLLGITDSDFKPSFEYFLTCLHPDDKDATLNVLNSHLARKGPYNVEYRLKRTDGTYIWINASGQALWDAEGKPMRMVGSVADINDRVATSKALQESNYLKSAVLAGAQHMVIATDLNGVITVFNNAAELALGYAADEIIGKQTPAIWHDQEEIINKAEILSAELGTTIVPGFDVFIAKVKMGGVDQNEWTFIHKNGLRFPCTLTATALKNDKQEITGYLGIVENISERKKAEEDKEKLIGKLLESNTELERFAYVASHDMQEPLRMMSSFGGLLGEEYANKLDAEGQEYLGQITRSARRMQDMVVDLLQYARLGGEAPQPVTVFMEKEFKHATDSLLSAINDRQGQVSNDLLPNVTGNPVQLMRLLQNLIGNGLKYQAAGTKPQVHVGVKDHANMWEFFVRDNGIGIAPEHLQKIFEPFKRLHAWDEYTGSGIGLAVCRKIVESHGGKIWVTSEPSKGSIFYFTLPKQV